VREEGAGNYVCVWCVCVWGGDGGVGCGVWMYVQECYQCKTVTNIPSSSQVKVLTTWMNSRRTSMMVLR